MELYCRCVDIFDKTIMDEFALEHKQNGEIYMAGDCSLILRNGYQQINDFYKWYKLINNLDLEKKLKKGQVGCSCFLVLNKENDKLIGIFDIRHSLNYPNGEVYGHIGVDIRPSERGKGLYKEILKLAVEKAKEFKIKPIVISCEYDNIISYKGISHVFGDYKEMALIDGDYFYIFEKDY